MNTLTEKEVLSLKAKEKNLSIFPHTTLKDLLKKEAMMMGRMFVPKALQFFFSLKNEIAKLFFFSP